MQNDTALEKSVILLHVRDKSHMENRVQKGLYKAFAQNQ